MQYHVVTCNCLLAFFFASVGMFVSSPAGGGNAAVSHLAGRLSCFLFRWCFWDGRSFVVVVQLLSRVQLFVTPWTTACLASLSSAVSPLLLLPSVFPSISVFSNEAGVWSLGISIQIPQDCSWDWSLVLKVTTTNICLNLQVPRSWQKVLWNTRTNRYLSILMHTCCANQACGEKSRGKRRKKSIWDITESHQQP